MIQETGGIRGLTVAQGRFPLVVFSHGYGGLRTQSSFLTAHLASWGFVVAAPDHLTVTSPPCSTRPSPEAGAARTSPRTLTSSTSRAPSR